MKKSEIIWIAVIAVSLISLIIVSGIFYFGLIVKSAATGHVIVETKDANQNINQLEENAREADKNYNYEVKS